jgi:hypothetical protein
MEATEKDTRHTGQDREAALALLDQVARGLLSARSAIEVNSGDFGEASNLIEVMSDQLGVLGWKVETAARLLGGDAFLCGGSAEEWLTPGWVAEKVRSNGQARKEVQQ